MPAAQSRCLALLLLAASQTNPQSTPLDAPFAPYPKAQSAPTRPPGHPITSETLAKVYQGPAPRQVTLDNAVAQLTIPLDDPANPQPLRLKSKPQHQTPLPPLPEIQLNGRPIALPAPNPPQNPEALVLRPVAARATLFEKPFDVKPLPHSPFSWPPRGMGIRITFAVPDQPAVLVDLVYELIDAEPAILRRLVLRNNAPIPLGLTLPIPAQDPLQTILRPGQPLSIAEDWAEALPDRRPALLARVAPWGKSPALPPNPHITLQTPREQIPDIAKAVKAAARSSQNAQTAALLIDLGDPLAWDPQTRATAQAAVASARAEKLTPALRVHTTALGRPEDKTPQASSGQGPLCWHSFYGVRWRREAPLALLRLGIDRIQFLGPLPEACQATTHPGHQNPAEARFQNQHAWKNLQRALLTIGIHPEAPQNQTPAFGPAKIAGPIPPPK